MTAYQKRLPVTERRILCKICNNHFQFVNENNSILENNHLHCWKYDPASIKSSDSSTTFNFNIECVKVSCPDDSFVCGVCNGLLPDRSYHIGNITDSKVYVSQANISHIHGKCPKGHDVKNIQHILKSDQCNICPKELKPFSAVAPKCNCS